MRGGKEKEGGEGRGGEGEGQIDLEASRKEARFKLLITF